MVDFSIETLKNRRSQDYVFHVLKEINGQPRLIYPAKVSTILEEEKKSFYDINSLKKNIKRLRYMRITGGGGR